MRWLLPLILLLAGAGGFIALKNSKPSAQALQVEEKSWMVSLQTVRHQDTAPTLLLYGRVESPQVAVLSAAITADVQEVTAFEGEEVGSGQLLVTLDDREPGLILDQRKAEVAEIEAQLEAERARHQVNQQAMRHEERLVELSRLAVDRAEDLASTNVGSRSQLDDAREDETKQLLALDNRRWLIQEYDHLTTQYEARLARARSLAGQAELDYSRTRITAPFNGRVAKLMVAAGDRVRPGESLLRLIDTSLMEVRAQIPNHYLPAIHQDLSSGGRLNARALVDGRPIEAELSRLASEVSPGSGGVDALFRVGENGTSLELGRTIEMIVTLPTQSDVVAVPLEAIYGNDRAYKLNDDRMVAMTVEKTGEFRTGDGKILALIRSADLHDGDSIIVTQLPNAIDGLRVRVSSQPGPAQTSALSQTLP